MYTIITENTVGIIANTKLCNPMVNILCAKSSILPKFIPMIKIIKATAINVPYYLNLPQLFAYVLSLLTG